MATLNQIKVNTGTEDNPSYVLHDVHDKRLDDGASSLVTTCTHLLATNAALSSFNPITSANLASVLGGHIKGFVQAFHDVNPSTKVIEITRNISPSTFCIIEVVALQTNHELAYSRIISNKWNVDYTKIISEINKNLFTIAYKDDKIYIKYNENNYGKVFLRSDSGNSLQYTIVSAIPSDATIVQ